jgi:Homeodomain-like domain
MPNPVAVEIVLSEAEREQLESWTRRRSSAQALAQRSRIVLLAAEGLKNTEIAQQLGIGRPMVTKWRSRFAVERLEAWSTSRDPVSRRPLATRRSRRSSPRPWRAPRAMRRIGQHDRWPPRSA